MIDTHLHLQDERYATDRELVLERAANAGVMACVIAGTDLETSRSAVRLTERYAAGPCPLYATVGIHPTDAEKLTPEALAELRTLAQHPRVVAIGEIGLDYYWPRQPGRAWYCASPAEQHQALEAQLELAAELELPVVLHDREAHADLLTLLKGWNPAPERRGTLHAYAGGPARLESFLALGFHIGMGGPVTFSKATDLHLVAQEVPLDRLLLETDGPYLTPHPYRGRRNEPAYLTHIAEAIAGLRELPAAEVVERTTANARALFQLGAPAPPAPGA